MIGFSNLSKHFGTQQILENASFAVQPGQRVGIVGPNGAGKSTIFELLAGRLLPDSGEISAPDPADIGYVRQQVSAAQVKMSVIDFTMDAVPELRQIEAGIHRIEAALKSEPGQNAESAMRRLGSLQTRFEQLGGYTLRNRAEAALCGLGFAPADLEGNLTVLSGGWQMRAELARTLVAEPAILMLDEPTNYLDVPAVEWLGDYLRRYAGTLLLISHDRYLLNSLTDVTLEVARGVLSLYPGNYDWYVKERQLRYKHLLAAKKNQDRRREQLERFVEKFRAKNTKASQAQSRLKMLEKMEDIRLPEPLMQAECIRLPEPPHSPFEILRLEDAGLTYDHRRWVFRHFSMRIEKGDRIALVGLNGMGKTTLLRTIAGRIPLTEGRRRLGPGVVVGYQAQDFSDVMASDMTVFAIARAATAERSDGEVRSLLGGFRFHGDEVEKKVAVLSGGEKVRLALARLLLKPCNLLVLDEPTTHLDIAAREALEHALADYAGTLCVVSHDIDFVRHLATNIYALTSAGITRYHGGYDYYREKLTAPNTASSPSATAPDQKTSTAQSNKTRKREDARRRQLLYARRRPLERRVAAAEKQLENLEAEQARLLKHLKAPSRQADFAEVNRRLTEIQTEITQATEIWERAALELENLDSPTG